MTTPSKPLCRCGHERIDHAFGKICFKDHGVCYCEKFEPQEAARTEPHGHVAYHDNCAKCNPPSEPAECKCYTDPKLVGHGKLCPLYTAPSVAQAPALKPCPFCGGEVIVCGGFHRAVYLDCQACEFYFDPAEHKNVWMKKEEVIEAWNRRTP